jgi:acylphosphatase
MTDGSTGGTTRRLEVRFEGEVQGVGFRWTTRKLANDLGLTGWVRNEWDGSVSMELQGSDAQIAEFFGRLNHAWGYYQPVFVIAEKEDIEPRTNEDLFRVRF